MGHRIVALCMVLHSVAVAVLATPQPPCVNLTLSGVGFHRRMSLYVPALPSSARCSQLLLCTASVHVTLPPTLYLDMDELRNGLQAGTPPVALPDGRRFVDVEHMARPDDDWWSAVVAAAVDVQPAGTPCRLPAATVELPLHVRYQPATAHAGVRVPPLWVPAVTAVAVACCSGAGTCDEERRWDVGPAPTDANGAWTLTACPGNAHGVAVGVPVADTRHLWWVLCVTAAAMWAAAAVLVGAAFRFPAGWWGVQATAAPHNPPIQSN